MPITPLPAVPKVVRVNLIGNSGEATPIQWQNVLHVQYPGGVPSQPQAETYAAFVRSGWAGNMAPECPATTVLTDVVVTDLSSDTAAQAVDIGSTAGTRGDDEIPANAAYLVTMPATARYRGGHPRQYLFVGGNADFLDAAHWSTAFTAEVQAHWRAFLNGITNTNVDGWDVGGMCTVCYYGHGGPYIPGATNPKLRVTPIVMPYAVDSVTGHQQMASQRRRIGRKRA